MRELSYQRMLDATAVYQPGQRVVVKLLEIHREDRDHIRGGSLGEAGRRQPL